jgi:hypothetical protein
MSTLHESYIAQSFLTIHRIITRGLRVSNESVQGVVKHGFKDETSREGLFKYIQALSSILHAHHLTEDELAFPYFRELMPDAPFDTLIGWHQEMVGMLDEIKVAAEACEGKGQLEPSLKQLENALGRLEETWLPHIQMETDEFIARADALINVDERLRLTQLFAEHGQKLSVPPYLTIPFLLYNLSPEDRLVFSQGMPAELLQHLVPVVWKPQWESMKPYLLE